jgi:hypothetical protein
MDVKLLNFEIMGDPRGALVAVEENRNIPFVIKRVYYIFGTGADVVRGKHAHKELEQVLICMSGTCMISVDNGFKKSFFPLSRPDQGLYIGKNIWREMYDFTNNVVIAAVIYPAIKSNPIPILFPIYAEAVVFPSLR